MGLRGRLKRLEREAQRDGVVLKLRNGVIRIFSDMEVFEEMFLTRTGLFGGKVRSSEVLDAVRAATPESREAFEEEYGSVEMVNHVIAADCRGGWVEEYRLLEDGTIETTHHEGGLRGSPADTLGGAATRAGLESRRIREHPSPTGTRLPAHLLAELFAKLS